jgi:hypothetical protein
MHQPLDPRPQIDMLAFDLLRLHLPNRVLLSGYMTLIHTPPIWRVPGDTKGRQQRLQLEKDHVLASSKHVRQLCIPYVRR